ncbi:ABC transporter permease [Rhizobium rhizogenes]|uniref:ABC transporter permease n=2 Tax=Rhizobium rhizogenes TaxID=359 RepID=UPI0022C12D3D|nr:ABC transporter permease [Rhizobium rhizogenes]MCZ7465880.1 ABC transporter permease [Rhizobium rhizogenes]
MNAKQRSNPMTKTLTRLFTGSQSRQGLWMVPLLITIVLSAILIGETDQFLNRENLFNLVAQAMPLIITAVGQLFVILVGGLDLSVGSLISFTTAVLALDAPGYILIPAVFVLAALLGLTNGYVVTRLNVHPIIATLAMQYIVLGAARILRPVSGGTIPDIVISSVSGSFLGIPMPIFWGICVALVAWKLLYGSRFGLHLFAIGGGISNGVEDATRNFGVADKRNIILAYVACSCFAALAGVFLAGRIVSGDPNVGLLFELDAITAVAIGGTQLSGGVGSLQGTIIGALVLALLSNGMNLVNISPFIQTAIKGGILLLVVGFQTRKKMGL